MARPYKVLIQVVDESTGRGRKKAYVVPAELEVTQAKLAPVGNWLIGVIADFDAASSVSDDTEML